MITPAEFMKIQLAASQKKFGTKCYMAGDHYIQQFGVPLPSLALQYMFGVENLPLGRMYGFRGKTESFKSSMVFYLMKVMVEYMGLGVLVECERKASITLVKGIIGEEHVNKTVELMNPGTLEEAQSMLTSMIQFVKKELPDRHIPYAFGWDSLRGVLSEATSNKIDKEGHYEKSYSAEAHMLSPYFAKMVEELSFWPIMLMFVQHEKGKMAEGGGGGAPGTSALGGDAPGFHATSLVRSRTVKPVTEGSVDSYATIEYRTVKNNLGIKGRRCQVNLHFHQEEDPETGKVHHDHWFDWDYADCCCILSDKLENKTEVKKILHLEEHSTNKGYFRSDTLGVKKATASEIMEMIRDDTELYNNLRRTMRIDRNLRFDQVEWKKIGGTKANPLMGWAVKEGVDLNGIDAAPAAKEDDTEDDKDDDAKK